MSTVNFTLVRDEKGRSLTVYVDHDGDFETFVLPESHVNFREVLDHLIDNPDTPDVDWIIRSSNLVHAIGTRLEGLSERVRVGETTLLFDGDPLNGGLTDHILRLVQEGDKAQYGPLVAFLEKVQTNPSQASIDSLYSYIVAHKFSITPDGDFIAYKGVALDGEGNSTSINHGKAIVNGVIHQGAIPNADGSIIEMPRSEVETNTGVHCASGLHAGTWDYASRFARGRVLVVKINPRDVVSVPDDHNCAKLRVSRYVVLSTIEQEYNAPTYDAYEGAYDEDEDEEYYDDGWGDGDDYLDDEDEDY